MVGDDSLQALNQPHSEVDIGRVAELFGLLSDPSRAAILYALLEGGELSQPDLCEWTGLTLQRCSDSLRILRTARVVGTRKSTGEVLYRLGGEQVRRLLEVAAGAAATRRLWLTRGLDSPAQGRTVSKPG